jgi:CDP-glycerol glycerophosphotransferase (TagB/SpsB family)/glycosyltransferase involved in cell wall biosynthesis
MSAMTNPLAVKRNLRRLRRLGKRAARAVMFDRHARWRTHPIRIGTVLYESFAGNGMLCNPEAIFRHLLDDPAFADLDHTWVLSDLKLYRATIAEFKGYPNVHFVRYRSNDYFRALATSEFLVNNATFPPEFGKRHGQVYLNTWHGTPLKKMGYDMPSGALEAANTLRNFVNADFLLSANPFMTETMYESAYKLNNVYRGTIIEEGYPRIDRQRLTPDKFITMRTRLENAGLELRGRDLVLYAPTWKGDSFSSPEDDIDALVAAVDDLQSRLGERSVVLLKTHQVVHAFAGSRPQLKRILVPNDIPTNEVLGVTTALVTDYSSIFFDFLATGRPIVFYTPDMTDYSGTRGVYIPASEWPGPVCTTMQDVAARLGDLTGTAPTGTDLTGTDTVGTESAAWPTYAAWRERFTCLEDGDVTRRVVDIVFRGRRRGYRLRQVKTDARPKALLYIGGMRSNGITASAINLLNAIDHSRVDVSVVYAYTRKREQRMNVEKIHPAVRQFPRVGGMNGTKADHIRRELAERRSAPDREDPFAGHSMWGDEWVRCFGDTVFDDVIDFSGYSPFWAALLANSPPARRSIWLHNAMAAEVHREVGGVQRMKRSLPAVFALYPTFDNLVSVSPSLNVLNRSELAAYAPQERFVAIRNLINADQVLRMAQEDLRVLDGHPLNPDVVVPGAVVPGAVGSAASDPGTVDPSAVDISAVDTSAVDTSADDVLIPEWVEPLRKREGTTWFVTVGRLSPEKNQARLIRAFAMVHAERPDARLLIVGRGPLRDQLQSQIDAHGLTDVAILTGAYPNPFAIMAASDCFVLSSSYEGQPMVLLEAAVLGLPIVSVNFSSVHDALPNDSIHIVDQNDEALADGMLAFLRHEIAPSSIDAAAYTQEVLSEFHRIVAPSDAGRSIHT